MTHQVEVGLISLLTRMSKVDMMDLRQGLGNAKHA